jgi:acetyl/propionyl-CoA carboxylase alpha subunit
MVEPRRHAIEVRLSAEDPAADFAPSPGLITAWRTPSGPGVRVDSGVEEGSVVSPDYDPLLAKLMVVADDRRAAIARLARALEEFEVAGLQTTLPFHRWLVDQPGFVDGKDLSTDFVARHWQPAELVSVAALRASELAARAGAGSVLSATPAYAAVTGRADQDAAGSPWWQAGILEAMDRGA